MDQFKSYICSWFIFICCLHFVVPTSKVDELEVVFDAIPKGNTLFSVSEREIECFAMKMVLYNDECHPLAVNGGPCAADEWLVLKRDKDFANPYQSPVCKKKPCTGKDQVWWPKTNECKLKFTILVEECIKQGKQLNIDAYGDGICICPFNFGFFVEHNQCYELNEQGPCPIDKVITYEPSSGSAVCYTETGTRLTRAIPRAHVIDAALLCRLDEKGDCREEVILREGEISKANKESIAHARERFKEQRNPKPKDSCHC